MILKPRLVQNSVVRSSAVACVVFGIGSGIALWLDRIRGDSYWKLSDNFVAGLTAGIVVLLYETLWERTIRKLAASEERFRRVVEHIEDALFVDDTEGRIVFANDQFLRLFGLSREQLPTTRLEDYVAPEYGAKLRDRHSRRIKGQLVPARFEYEGMRQDGGRLFLEVEVVPVANSEGVIIGTQSTLRDITERKRAEEALRESEEISRTTFDQAAIGVAHVSVDGRWMRVNDKLCSILGYSREELQNLSFRQITHPDDLEKDLDCVRKLLADEIQTYTMEKRYIRKDHSFLWANLTVSLVRTSKGEPKYFISVVEDICVRKQAEKALHTFSGQLIATQEREQSRIAKELHDGIGQHLALLSIKLDRLRRENPDPGKNEALTQLSNHVGSVVEEVRAISHGLHPAHLEYVGLSAALNGLCSELAHHGKTKVSFENRDVPRDLPDTISLCFYRITQEALQNVIRHSAAQHVTVGLYLEDRELHLRISDDGKGFDSSGSRSADSIGILGMHERIGLLGGAIKVESRLGEGTTIDVRAPLSSYDEVDES